MAGTTLGTAYVQIRPSADGIKGSIQDVLGGEAESAGTSTGSKIASFAKKAILAAGIGTAVVKGLKASLAEGAELQQNIGGTEAVFGKYAKSIQKSATTAYKEMGLSASDYMATANKMASLFQGSGVSQQKSLGLTTKAMQRAADVASVMGLDTNAAMESIAGAAKGNFTMMDNLGVAMNATTLEAYALEKGINFKWNTASNAEKAELAMKMFMDRTKQYEGNFARESEETFSGSLGAMKAAAQNLFGSLALGQNIQPALNGLLSTANAFFFNNFIPMIGTIIKGLPTIISGFFKQAVPLLVAKIITAVTSVADKLTSLANGLTADNVKAWATTTGADLLRRGAELIGKLATALINNLPKIVGAIGRIGIAIVKGLGSAIWPKITAAANGIKEKFMTPINTLKDKVKAIIDKIKGFFSFNISLPHIPMPHFSISPSGWKIGDLLKGSLPKLGISWYAEGGIATKPVLGFGEAGPEALLPLDPFWKKMDEIADRTQGNVTINVYGSPGMDVNQLASAVEQKLIKAQKQRRQAWGTI